MGPDSQGNRADLWLDLDNECLWSGERRILLPPKAYAVIEMLSRSPGRLVTKDDLLASVWPDTFVGDAVLKVNIKQLRDLLGDDARAPWLIETVHRRGYRLIAPLRRGPKGTEPLPLAEPVAAQAEERRLLVGRDKAVATLQQAWLSANGGQRQLVFVTGEAGIGKTALVEAFLERIERAEPAVHVGRGQCVEGYGASEAYMPVLDALDDLLRSGDGVWLAEALRRHAPSWGNHLPGLVEPAAEATESGGGSSRELMLREIATALEVASSQRCVVLFLEDLHWSDPSTVALLAFLAQRRQPSRLCVIGTFRPVDVILGGHPLREARQTLLTRKRCVEIPLGYLETEDVRTYLKERLAGPPDGELVELLLMRTGGNPLFLVSVFDHLVEHGLIDIGRRRLAGPADAGETVVPEVLRGVLERRIETIAANDRSVLEAASVAGSEFLSAAVAAALEQPIAAVEDVCAQLAVRGDLVRARGTMSIGGNKLSGRYEFVHVLYRNVLYERIPAVRRAEMHRRVGVHVETYDAGPAELAYHFARSGSDADSRRAVEFAGRAARRAASVFAYDEAVAQCDAALRIAESLESRDAHLEAACLIALAEAMQRAGRIVDADGAFRRGVEAAKAVGDPVLLARAAIGIGHGYQRIGQPDPELIESLQAALAALGDADHPVKALTLAHLDYALSSVPGAADRRAGLARQALEMARRIGDVETHVWTLQYTRWAFSGPTCAAEWREGVREVDALLPRVVEAEHELMLRYMLVTDLLEFGDADRARAELARVVQRAEEAQVPWSLWLVWRLRVAMALLEGRLDEARTLIDETLHYGQATDHPNVLQMYGAQTAMLRIQEGDLAAVADLVELAVEDNPTVPTWRAVAAYVAVERGDRAAAQRELDVVAADGFAHVPQDTAWLVAMCFAAIAAQKLGDATAGRQLHALLLPYGDRFTGLSSSVLSLGHPERYIGLAAAAAGMSCAVEHLQRARDANRRIGATPWAAAIERDLERIAG